MLVKMAKSVLITVRQHDDAKGQAHHEQSQRLQTIQIAQILLLTPRQTILAGYCPSENNSCCNPAWYGVGRFLGPPAPRTTQQKHSRPWGEATQTAQGGDAIEAAPQPLNNAEAKQGRGETGPRRNRAEAKQGRGETGKVKRSPQNSVTRWRFPLAAARPGLNLGLFLSAEK